MNDKSIHTGLCPGGNERMNRLFRLMLSGRIDPTPMTTHTFGFYRPRPRPMISFMISVVPPKNHSS